MSRFKLLPCYSCSSMLKGLVSNTCVLVYLLSPLLCFCNEDSILSQDLMCFKSQLIILREYVCRVYLFSYDQLYC